ncbi:dephospho-CoA kinase [Zafaria cholistanensis]|uniref:Dephospho-CoA kinase n=1 Tax=Zafaria cholistanensis TaxID=1682741 RepID=A0A5A7NUG7_9MICC|nr:dephospho-CoA kinase [Zafaria cholistanensis]GER23431.1 dephospho-CoA kinase [Zafaria cholistanensis]
MLDIGLTGGIAAGKSAVATRLAELGAVLIDADRLARAVVEPGTPGLAAIAEAFGPGVIAPDGTLDRAALGALVFADASARERLNGIVHPLVRAAALERRAQAAQAAPDAVVVEDIPLLAESGQAHRFALVITVQAPLAERIRRMVRDRGMAESDARARIAAQATDGERAAIADVVLENSGTLEELRAAVDRVWRERILPLRDAAAPPAPREVSDAGRSLEA